MKPDSQDLISRGLGACTVYVSRPLSVSVALDKVNGFPNVSVYSKRGTMSGDTFVHMFGGYDTLIMCDIWKYVISTYKWIKPHQLGKIEDNIYKLREHPSYTSINEFFIETALTKKGKCYHEWYLEMTIDTDFVFTFKEKRINMIQYSIFEANGFCSHEIEVCDLSHYHVVL